MKILIVDDESLIREMLVSAVLRLQYTNIVEAKDGKAALEIIKSSSIQVVIADIRMPGMDGLELLSHVMQDNSKKHILFIFVSGYDLFEYAQKAVKLGAFGYLLKPVKETELKESLERAEEKLASAHREQEMIDTLKVKMNQGVQFMRKHLILDLIKEDSYIGTILTNKFKQLNILLTEPCFAILYISVDNFQLLSSETSLYGRDLIKFSLDNIVSEIMPGYNVITYYFEIDDGLGVMLNFSEDHPLADSAAMIDMCNDIRNSIAIYTKFTVTIGIGSTFDNIMQLNKSFESAQKAITQRLVKGSNKVIPGADLLGNKARTPTISPKIERDLQFCFETLDIDAAMKLITGLFASFRNFEHADASILMKFNFQLIMLIFKFMDQMDINPEEMLGDELKLYNQVNSCSSVDEIIQWFSKILQASFDLVLSKKNNSSSSLIDKAKEYIHHQYSRDITLEIVAQHVYLSPTYFSRMFKEEVGENFSNYVLNYRMDVARSLLKEGIYKANQVSVMVGFQDEKYFYKVFKKITGFTPSEYRQR